MSVVALRYAHAFAGVVADQRLNAEAVQQQLHDFRDTFQGSRELREVLTDPAISREQKLKVLDAIAGKIGMVPQVRNFVAVIMDHDRLADLGEILDEYHAVADEKAGLSEAEIVSARALSEEERFALEAQVAKLAGGRVRATYSEDSSLLGGVVVRIGSKVYDGSIRAQLERLKHRLVTA
jgi:F-type H+-transporting ATPase subunit delta